MPERPQQPVAKTTDLRLLGALAVVLAPHVLHLPPWVMLGVGMALAWRVLAVSRNWSLPGGAVRMGLCALAFVAVYAGFGRINGQQAGVSLLVLMLGLKLTELRTHRDRVFTLFLAYFVLVTQFLFSQSLLMGAYLFLSAWLVTASLMEISHPQGPLSPKRSLRSSAVLIGQALPLMAMMFILFPRLPGPLWGLPNRGATAITGLGNRMSPGSISRLARDNSVAFRAHFAGKAPPRRRMYWRGPVLSHYNGATWTVGNRHIASGSEVAGGHHGIRYEIIMEPSGTRNLPALDMPVSGPPKAAFTTNGQMLAHHRVRQRRLYHARSILNYRLQPHLSPAAQQRDLAMPDGADPRSRALVRRWQSRGLRGAALARRALHFFHNQPFYYTLNPSPLSGPNRVDQFLFHTRHGFCEHYASAFTVLMRLAGIPARVVTGYYGGEFNSDGDYFIIRHSNAHAWSEIWLPGRGWVRYDPTAAIDPKRVELNATTTPGGGSDATGGRSGYGFLHRLSLRWDWVQETWDRTLLGYGPKVQSEFLGRFGLPDWRAMLLALTALGVGFLSLVGGVLMWQARPRRRRQDAVTRAWQRFCRRLARRGLPRADGEGPRDYARRVAATRPALAGEVQAIAGLYIDLKYRERDDDATRRRFLKRVRRFRPRLKR